MRLKRWAVRQGVKGKSSIELTIRLCLLTMIFAVVIQAIAIDRYKFFYVLRGKRSRFVCTMGA